MTATRERVVAAASALLVEGGREAVSTRAVCAAAGVQAPTIYRIFGDKQGLLDAVAVSTFEGYLRDFAELEPEPDPVAELCRGWDLHVAFGLAHPFVYALAYGDVRAGAHTPAAEAAAVVLAALVHRVAEVGRLRVPERLAVEMLAAAGSGTTLTLIATPSHERHPALSDAVRDTVLAAITTAPATPAGRGHTGVVAAATHLRANLPHANVLTRSEQVLLHEWLDRITLPAP